ncbi:unnamed protein product [Malus baccata var. baccata]
MDSDAEALEEKLVSLLGQMVYKNKNQHRRGSYFQHLMKVRRDLRLLQSTKLEELFGCCFQSITGNRPKQKLHLLKNMKFQFASYKRKCESGKHNFMERLLGAARLLSQMVETMLKAALYPLLASYRQLCILCLLISMLLARSFFMGFSLTVLALLARLRVLVQQILLDVVSVFNMVSSLCQKQQSVKIVQGGLEVFREFYPINEEIIILECVWKSDKFELIERTHKTEMEVTMGLLKLWFVPDDETIRETADANHSAEKGPVEVKENKTNLMQMVERCEDVTTVGETPSMKFSEDGCLLTGTSPSSSSDASKLKSGPVKVAFIQVKTPSQSNTTEIPSKETDINSNTKEDSSFSLLSSGNVESSLIDHE